MIFYASVQGKSHMCVIESNNPEIQKHLEHLVALVRESGGWIHPYTKIESFDSDLRVLIEGRLRQDEKFIKLPMRALLNTEKLNIKLIGDEFSCAPDEDAGISKIQRDLADAMLNLYNLTGKAKWLRENSFWLGMADYPELFDKILATRSVGKALQERRDMVVKGLKGKALTDFIGENFIKTRVLGHKDIDTDITNRSIMPVIDFLNHHWSGSGFSFSNPKNEQEKGPNILSVQVRQPFQNSNECFAFYTPMDCLDTLFSYNFVDEEAPFVRSVPIELEVEDIGKIVIRGMTNTMNKNKLNKKITDIRAFIPIQVEKSPDEHTKILSHLLVPSLQKPLALRRTLSILISNFSGNKMDTQAVTARTLKAEEEVIAKNLAVYTDIRNDIKQVIAEKGSTPILAQLNRSMDLQLIKLNKYGSFPGKVAAAQQTQSQKKAQAAG